jgi:hypothetical protein
MAKLLFISTDIMFASRVRGAAAQEGLECLVASASASDLTYADHVGVIIDLANTNVEQLQQITSACLALDPSPQLIAFGPHVDTAQLEAARTAGCHQVLTRGDFNQRMRELLRGLL